MKWLLFIVSFVVTFLLYRPILGLSFTQDDWFLLRQAKFNSPREQLLASLPNPDSIYFRPLGIQGYFWFAWRVFGLHPGAYRIVSLTVHSINALLVFVLARDIVKRKAWIVWLFYLTAPLHFAAIGWVGNINFIGGAFWILSTIAVIRRPQPSVILVMAFYVLGLLTNELAITTPALIFVLSRWTKKISRERLRLNMLLMAMVATIYAAFRVLFPHANRDAYEIGVGANILQNIRWLLLWTVGWTEPIKDYFISLWQIKPEFIQTFPLETTVQVLTSLVLLSVLLTVVKDRRCWYGILFFLLSVSPVLLFRQHVSPHYAMIGSIGIFLTVVTGLSALPRSVTLIVVALWIAQAASVMRIHRITHWWIQHVQFTQELILQARSRYHEIPPDRIIVLSVQDPKRAEIVLAGDSAMQVLYNDPAVKTEFVKGEWSSLPESESSTTWSGDPLDGSKR